MRTAQPIRFQDLGLALLTLALLIFGLLSARQQWIYHPPSDNALWAATPVGLRADQVNFGGAAWRAGIRPGDLLVGVAGKPITQPEELQHALFAAGPGQSLSYAVLRAGALQVLPVVVGRAANHGRRYLLEDMVGFLYLAIGLFVVLRRRAARQALHFYLFCLVSFVLYAFHFTGKLNPFDWTVFWCNEVALLLAPCLFLHFALTFPRRKGVLGRAPGLVVLLYGPAALFLLLQVAVSVGALQSAVPATALQLALDRIPYALFAVAFVLGTIAFYHSQRHAATVTLRQQMKWITRGATLALAPFLLLYVGPYLGGVDLPRWSTLATLSLVLIPLTLGYAIVRYRLMDVDVIFRRGVVYSLAAMAIVAIYFGGIALAAAIIHLRAPNLGPAGWILAIVVTALLFEPVKNWLQERLDRLFYRERYDYRRTLIEFGRQMNAEPELESMLSQVVERLAATLSLERVAVFLAGEADDESFYLARGKGLKPGADRPSSRLRDWDPQAGEPRPGLRFLENPAHAAAGTPYGETMTALDLNYLIPCQSKGRTVAVLGMGRTMSGDLLTSEDVELVETLAAYLAVAIENARLYETLRRQAREYERLKDFNENIVESIGVGVAAVGRDDRVEGWNAQMEVLTALPRAAVLGRPIAEALGQDFAREYYRARPEQGVTNLYKFRLNLGQGGERTVNLAMAPMLTRQFEIVGRIILVDDITARVELEQKLVQAERLSSIGLLAAGVAHEVNTPLAVISNYTQLLAKQLPADDPRAPIVDRITRQTFRAAEIVGSLLNFSRTGGAHVTDVDLNYVITETLSLVEHALRTARIEVVTELSAGLPAILGDAGRLQQVFLNLVLNARDAMPEGGTLRLTSECGGDRVRVRVADSGQGIAPEARDRIFDPFFTTKLADRSRQHGLASGTGLGLSVTYGIIQEHGGSISVASEPGRGACFQLEFPAVRKVVHA